MSILEEKRREVKVKLSWIKLEEDDQNFKVPEKLGMHIEYLKAPEQIDEKLAELLKEEYDTIMITNELAGFSEDIIKKYYEDETVKIIISPR